MDRSVRTTLALPEELLREVDKVIRAGKAKSRNELVATALRHELAALERVEVDAAFAAMAGDAEYQEEARKITDGFARADWEAFQMGENLQ